MKDILSYIMQGDVFLEGDFLNPGDFDESAISKDPLPEILPILPLKNTILFPGVVIPITVGRDKSIQLIKDSGKEGHSFIGVTAQRDPSIEDPGQADIYKTGTIAKILKKIRMPDGSITIAIQGRSRFEISEMVETAPYFKAKVNLLPDVYPPQNENKALLITLKNETAKLIELSPHLPSDAKIALQNITNLGFLVHFTASNLNIDLKEKQALLEMNTLSEKAQKVVEFLAKEIAVLHLSEEIHSKVRTDLDKQQREYFLRQQIKAIHDELGEGGVDSDLDEFRKRAKEKSWPKRVQEVFDKEIARLSKLNPNMPDFAVVSNYIDWLLDLPWEQYTKDNFDFNNTKQILENDHYGLEKVKDRILEYLAVLKLRGDKKAPILCFYGPPGVGKTSLGKSIARSLDREFVRISLGGMRDEAEIRGHRKTYIGAMPGRIIQGMKKAKSGNPVFMLDEIDKVGSDFRGDPSSALLEVLDPEQNDTFQDHFLEVEYDLSRVMFIATANMLDSIHPALRDRMEIIEINGYSLQEKKEIAKRHLIPKALEDHGIKPKQLVITDGALGAIIDGYTRESGVRNLAQKIANVCRVAAKEIVLDEKASVKITEENLEKHLGVARFENDTYQFSPTPGVAIGLAWTPVGGDILFIETTLHPGNGRLTMTGKLGDVMKESAELAFHFLKANAEKLDIPSSVFTKWDIHVHFPAGAIPKDGPSAGIAILTAMTSLFTQRLVKSHIAMTGEITLRGKVLPVGGIKEKLLAATRAGIKTVFLSAENRKDVSEIKDEYLKGMKVIYVDRMEEVLGHTLEPKKWKSALNLLKDHKLNEIAEPEKVLMKGKKSKKA